jgi:LmeA-like phospholipid-binding
VTGRPLQVDSAPDGDARLTGTIQILGRTVSASTRAELGAQDGALSVRPTQLDTATRLDRASELLLSQRFTFLVPLDPLPFGQQVTEIHPAERGIRVEAGGMDVIVRP